jgi:hypothetical protein
LWAEQGDRLLGLEQSCEVDSGLPGEWLAVAHEDRLIFDHDHVNASVHEPPKAVSHPQALFHDEMAEVMG